MVFQLTIDTIKMSAFEKKDNIIKKLDYINMSLGTSYKVKLEIPVMTEDEKTKLLEELQERLKAEQKRTEEQQGNPFFSVIIDEEKVHSYRTTNQPDWTNIQKIVGGKIDMYSKIHLKKEFQKFMVYVKRDHNILYDVNNNCNFMLTDEYARLYPIHGKCIIMKDANFSDSISMTQEDLDLFIKKN